MTALRKLVVLFGMILSMMGLAFGADGRPNILFLLADDQRADTIAALGNPHIRTPSLDRLVRSGLTFNRAYMQGALNPATCMPSRAMLLSGRCVFRIDEKLMRDETWPAAFGRAGYTTFMTGKVAQRRALDLPQVHQRSLARRGKLSEQELSNRSGGLHWRHDRPYERQTE